MKTLYFKYAESVFRHIGLKNTADLDYEATRLLEILAVAHYIGKPLTVSQAMALSGLASPASIHRKLSQLREYGYIEGVHPKGDRRTQFLTPTNKANLLFETLGSLMLQATSEEHALVTKSTLSQNNDIDEFHC